MIYFFYHFNNHQIMQDGRYRSNIRIGERVRIEAKKDMGTGKLTEGIVKEILTLGSSHPLGIMVILDNGIKGRVKHIANKQNEFDTETQTEYQINKLDLLEIPTKEDPLNEFKSTFRFDLTEEVLRKAGKIAEADGRKRDIERKDEIRKEIAITVAGFANAEGGYLFLGIDDDGTILGLEKDMKVYNFKNTDVFALSISESLENYLKNRAFISSKVKMSFQEKNNKTIYIIKVLPAPSPVFVHTGNSQENYVRSSTAAKTQKMETEDFIKYCISRFPNWLRQD